MEDRIEELLHPGGIRDSVFREHPFGLGIRFPISVRTHLKIGPEIAGMSDKAILGLFTRAASSTSGRAKNQFPMCSLRSLTCSQVHVLPRQGMVGPSNDSRLRLGGTPIGASSAVNGQVCRWRKLPAWTGQPLQPTCRPQHYEKTAAPKVLPSLKPVRRVSWNSGTVIHRRSQ